MKSPSLLTLFILVLSATILAACNIPGNVVTTADPGLVFTQAAQTAQAIPHTQTSTSLPTVVVTPVPPTPTTIITPTSTSTSVPTATSTTAATPTSASCTDQMDFVSDVTIPDDTEMLPGQEFIKTWRLENTGTCTWTKQYALHFVTGDQMSGISPLSITSPVTPGSTVDLSVTFKAPGTVGTFRGDWILQNASGLKIGLGRNSDQPFYLRIKVVEGISELNLGAPTWRDTLDDTDNWYLLETANTKFTEGDGKLVMKSIHPGGGEEWGISNQPSLQDYYLQATFITGSACSGLDRYGLLGRAPDPNQGYVFEFTCDGHYRLYTWDGKNYEALQEWRTAASILAGPDKTNVMGLWMKGTTLRLYANGHKIAEFTDSMFDEGQFGLVIGSVNTQDFTVSVDQIEYWEFTQ